MLRYIIILATGVAVGVLTRVMSLAGLLNLEASTAGYLVTVIALGVEVSHDIRTYQMGRFDRWLSNYLTTARPSARKAEQARQDRFIAERIRRMPDD